MFELLVAVFVVAVTLVALLGLVTGAIGNSTFAGERTQAAKYTQQAVEWLRAQRDADWAVFSGRGSEAGTTYCLNGLDWNTGGCSSAELIDAKFKREVVLIYDSAAESVEAQIITSWSDASGLHESKATTNFTNWRTR